MLASLLLLWPTVAQCGNSANMYAHEYSRYGTLVQTDTPLTLETNGKIDVILLIFSGPGGNGSVPAAWFTLERTENGLRFHFFDADHKNVGVTQTFKGTIVDDTSATWDEQHELVTESGRGSEVARYTATLDAAGYLLIRVHSNRTMRRLFGLVHSKSSAEYEGLFPPQL